MSLNLPKKKIWNDRVNLDLAFVQKQMGFAKFGVRNRIQQKHSY